MKAETCHAILSRVIQASNCQVLPSELPDIQRPCHGWRRTTGGLIPTSNLIPFFNQISKKKKKIVIIFFKNDEITGRHQRNKLRFVN